MAQEQEPKDGSSAMEIEPSSDAKKSGTDAKEKDGRETKKDAKSKDEELSEEDQQLKSELEMLVERLQEGNTSLYRPSLEALRNLIRTSTSSMTSVPKPLKFLRPLYANMVATYESWPEGDDKRFFADILSVLAMTYYDGSKRDSLRYRLLGSNESIGSWGHEYVRHLSLECIAEYPVLVEKEESTEHLLNMAMEIVPFFLAHNAEADACDLLLELEAMDKLPQFVDKNTFARVCLYIVSCVNYVAPPDDVTILKTAHTIYRNMEQFPQAVQIAIRLNDHEMIKDDFDSCTDPILKRQLAFLLARQQIQMEVDDEVLQGIINNSRLSEYFLSLARDLDIMEPKVPEDIYKSHLDNTRTTTTSSIDSARQNLASTFVNAFVNVGFGTDKLLTGTEGGNSWIYKNKDHGMMSAAASLGTLFMWDVEVGLTQIDKYLYSNDEYIKSGAILAIGVVNSGVRNESDPALALVAEYVDHKTLSHRIAALMALGIAYAGSGREDISELLLPSVSDSSLSMEISATAALSLGFIFVGSCNGDIASTILQTMMERDEPQLKDTYAKYMAVGLALLFLGKQDAAEATLETLKAIEHPLAKQAGVLVHICAFAGTGNVLKIQEMLHICNDHLDPEKEDDRHQGYAALGVALIAMGEEVGSDMSMRTFNHLMHYGEPVIRKAVPLALGLLCASNPVVNVLDVLSKYSHDNDQEVAVNAIFAMGLVGAGTNNARLAQMLRQLAAYYHKEPSCLFTVRLAQGLVHMGKGTMTINPYHTNRMLMSPNGVAGLLTVLVSMMDAKNTILGKAHYMMFYLVSAIYPRFLITLDEELQSIPITVRVGQAVDVVGQAGRPKTITGFQTHSTPVLMAYTERAETATDEYLPLTPVLEGLVIVKKNPDFVASEN